MRVVRARAWCGQRQRRVCRGIGDEAVSEAEEPGVMYIPETYTARCRRGAVEGNGKSEA